MGEGGGGPGGVQRVEADVQPAGGGVDVAGAGKRGADQCVGFVAGLSVAVATVRARMVWG